MCINVSKPVVTKPAKVKIKSAKKKGKKVTYTLRCIDKNGKTISGYNSTGWSITRK